MLTKKHCLLFLISILCIWTNIRCTEEEEEEPYYKPITINATEDNFVFFHMSDTHATCLSLENAAANNANPNLDFTILTGDIISTPYVSKVIANTAKPLLMIPGNHDAYDFSSEYDFRRDYLGLRPNDSLQFADNIHNYWYRDFKKKGRRMRVIGIDQYQIQTLQFDTTASAYDIMMSQQQIDWFCKTLNDASDYDGIVVALHSGLGCGSINKRDTNYVNEFVSTKAHSFKYSYDYRGTSDPRLLADIIKAYQTGNNICNVQYSSGCPNKTITVNTSFAKANDNFIGLFGGHLHWDEAEKIPNYNILQVLVTYCGDGYGSSREDLLRDIEGQEYALNVNIIDFNDKTIKIKREGARLKDDGTTRDSICFNWQTCEIVNK